MGTESPTNGTKIFIDLLQRVKSNLINIGTITCYQNKFSHFFIDDKKRQNLLPCTQRVHKISQSTSVAIAPMWVRKY